MNAPSPAKSGAVVIQYNWEEQIRKNENIWIYYKELNERSKHGNAGDGTFNVISQSTRSILIHQVPNNIQTRFVCPAAVFSTVHSKSIISLDVANSGLGVSASTDNKLHIWQTEDGTVRRILEGHLFDVYSCRLFPSGLVVLSGGADMQIKIWDAATGLCPVTLGGHTASVTDTAIIEKGKNIISVSKDGTARLWNCAEAKSVATLIKVGATINCCDVIDVEGQLDFSLCDDMAEEIEFGTKGKLLAFGCEDGKVYVMCLHSREVVCTHFLPSSVLCLAWLSSLYLVLGLQDGRVMTLNARSLNEVPQQLSHDSVSGVLCIKPFVDGFILGRKDGLCQFYHLNGTSPVHLTGSDCDPIYDISTDSHFVYTACRDAVIRKYRIQDMRLRGL